MKEKLLKTRGWLNRIAAFLAIEALVLFVAGSLPIKPSAEVRVVQVEDPLPSVKLSPEELAQVEVNDALRDRLRSDPRSQSLLRAVRKDLAMTQWTKSLPENPVWASYGAKAFPLLDYYTQSDDPTRQRYGIEGIRKLGQPYTRLWLQKQLKRRSHSNFWQPNYRGQSYADLSQTEWQKEFGLDDPQFRAEMLRLAQENLAPKNSPNDEKQFNLLFLNSLNSPPVPPAPVPRDPVPPFRIEPEKNLSQWWDWNNRHQLSAEQIQQVYPYYRNLSAYEQESVLSSATTSSSRAASDKVGELSPVKQVLLQNLMNDPQAPYPERLQAIVALDRHNDAAAAEALQDILDNHLNLLSSQNLLSGQNLRSTAPLSLENLRNLNFHTKYPESRFAQGCQEYENLTGRSYFEDRRPNPEILRKIEQKPPQEKVNDWQDWLDRYPDHPGADDAAEHLAQSYTALGNPIETTRYWFRFMTRPPGNRDTQGEGFRHVRQMLDLGLSIDQLQTLLDDPELTEIALLLRYALAVHNARDHNYAQALQISAELDMNQLSDRVSGGLPERHKFFRIPPEPDLRWQQAKQRVRQEMQKMLVEQRQRWQQLVSWQQENTSESRYKIASSWATTGGWKNGYLPFWNGSRAVHLPTSNPQEEINKDSSRYDSNSWCQLNWVCDRASRGEAAVRTAYQKGNSNAVALALYQDILNDPKTPDTVRERSLYMVAATLMEQWANFYSIGEMHQMHPPAGVIASPKKRVDRSYGGTYLELNIATDYQRRIDGLIAELQTKFPQSSYTDDLLMFNYFLCWQPRYLQQIVEKYPNSDRVEEAQVLLTTPPPDR